MTHQFKCKDNGWAVADRFLLKAVNGTLITQLPEASNHENSGMNWGLLIRHNPFYIVSPDAMLFRLIFIGLAAGWREVCRIRRANACDSQRGWSLGSSQQAQWGSSAHQLILIGSWPPHAKIEVAKPLAFWSNWQSSNGYKLRSWAWSSLTVNGGSKSNCWQLTWWLHAVDNKIVIKTLVICSNINSNSESNLSLQWEEYGWVFQPKWAPFYW